MFSSGVTDPQDEFNGYMTAKATTKKNNGSGAKIGFEAKLWLAAVKLCNNMNAAEYKHAVLGFISPPPKFLSRHLTCSKSLHES